MEKVNKTIFITTSFEGVHCYPSAPESVIFLRAPHRHIFGVKVEVEVYHDDRELEFILFKRQIDSWLNSQKASDGVWSMGAMSCEMVAVWLIDKIQQNITHGKERYIRVTVDEDGENGATVETFPAEVETKVDLKEVPAKIDYTKLSCDTLTLNKYQETAYNNIQEHESHKEEVMHWAIGLGEEAGETLSVIKHKYYGGVYDLADLVSELGDTLWHIAALCTLFGIKLEDVALFNLAKLDHRYPSNTFDYSRSVNRKKLGDEFKSSIEYNAIMDRIAKTPYKEGYEE